MTVQLKKPNKENRHEFKSSREHRKAHPRAEAAECWSRGRLTFDQRSEVEDAQFTIRYVRNPETEQYEEVRGVSIPLMRRALVWALIEDSGFHHNLEGEDGKPLENKRSVFNEYLDPDDLADFGDEMLPLHFPEIFVSAEEARGPANPTSASSPSDAESSPPSLEARRTSKQTATGS